VVVQLDRTLADLLAFTDRAVGLGNTLIVLSADHGMADMPEYVTELGFKAGRLDPDDIVAQANKAGRKFGVDEIVRFFYRPYLYLNDEKIAEAGIDRRNVEQAVADALTDSTGIALAVPVRRLSSKGVNPLVAQVRRNHHATRSGDIYIIQDPLAESLILRNVSSGARLVVLRYFNHIFIQDFKSHMTFEERDDNRCHILRGHLGIVKIAALSCYFHIEASAILTRSGDYMEE
jgi:hypothetical protein